jgi:hypothetical protein
VPTRPYDARELVGANRREHGDGNVHRRGRDGQRERVADGKGCRRERPRRETDTGP